jgi:hypothetical protein
MPSVATTAGGVRLLAGNAGRGLSFPDGSVVSAAHPRTSLAIGPMDLVATSALLQ